MAKRVNNTTMRETLKTLNDNFPLLLIRTFNERRIEVKGRVWIRD